MPAPQQDAHASQYPPVLQACPRDARPAARPRPPPLGTPPPPSPTQQHDCATETVHARPARCRDGACPSPSNTYTKSLAYTFVALRCWSASSCVRDPLIVATHMCAMSHNDGPRQCIMINDRERSINSPESLLPKRPAFPGGSFHLSTAMCRRSPSDIAAATRSAIRSPVKPACSCSNAGLPCVTYSSGRPTRRIRGVTPASLSVSHTPEPKPPARTPSSIVTSRSCSAANWAIRPASIGLAKRASTTVTAVSCWRSNTAASSALPTPLP